MANSYETEYAEAVARERVAKARLDEARWWFGKMLRPPGSEKRIAELEVAAQAAEQARQTVASAADLSSWRVLASEERAVGGVTYTHLTIRCTLCGNTTGVIFPARETPKIAPCDCVQIRAQESK